MESYKLLRDLIKFNTIQDKENKKIIEYLEKFLQNLGFRTEYKGKYLICSIGKQFKLGFLGHTDTVEYIDEWKIDPFELTKIENKLYGLGTCDMKGGIAAMLEAISKVNLNKLKYGMKLYFTYDEEISFNGVYDILKAKEEFPDTMIFGEPTNNKILNGSKGLLEYEVYFKGIKAHSSNPEKGKSAILNAVKFSYELEAFYEKEIKPLKNKNYEILFVTGKNSYEEIKKIKFSSNVKVVPYIENMTRIMKNTDIIISRAGASTLSEIIALKIPSILIPSPYVPDNHQYKNALDLSSNNAAILIEEKDLNGNILVKTIDEILNDEEKIKDMKKNLEKLYVPKSATKIYETIRNIIDGK